MTVLFCDVKGFVGVSEEMTPQGLVKVMNRYFSIMSAPIHEHGGIIDKYIGDAIMAYWGPPFTADADQARLRRLAALDMLARVAPFRAELPDLLGLRNVPISFDIRVGIATGEALVGSIGSEVMMSYTVMGETVNLASRLEGANKLYGGRILASEATVTAAGAAIETREIDRVVLVGQSHAQPVYEIMGRSGALTESRVELRNALRRGPCRLPQPPLGGSAAGFHRCARGDAGRRADPHHAQAHRWSCSGAAGGELGRRLASRSEINDARRAAWLQRSGGWSRRRTACQSSVMSLASMAARRCSNFTSSSFGRCPAHPAATRRARSSRLARRSACGVLLAMSLIGAHQPQTDRDVGNGIVPDLLERGIEQAIETHPRYHEPQHMRRSVIMRWRRRAAGPADHDTAELVDAADRRAGIVDRGRYRAQPDIDDLDDAELDILLHGAGRADIEGGDEMERAVCRHALRLRHAQSGTPAGTNWPTRRSTMHADAAGLRAGRRADRR